ncbi:MAG TPA: hypothetical protein VFX49_15315 [Chloroflexota bacterium]|nr:hypothetical protein [Chloroflexota bacterium]
MSVVDEAYWARADQAAGPDEGDDRGPALLPVLEPCEQQCGTCDPCLFAAAARHMNALLFVRWLEQTEGWGQLEQWSHARQSDRASLRDRMPAAPRCVLPAA